MIKYAQIINEITKQVAVGLGTDSAYYESIGMAQMEVEYCEWNKCWYVAGYVPQKPEPTHDEQIEILKKQLAEVDSKSTRSMRAILAETATQEDRLFLNQLEVQAEDLRRQIQELQDTLGE